MNNNIQVIHKDEGTEVSRSLESLLTNRLQELVQELPKELVDCTEEEYLKDYEPNKIDLMLRKSFWEEYDKVQAENLPTMDVGRIYDRICTKQTFYQRVVCNPKRLAFIVKEPERLNPKFKRIMDHGISRLEDLVVNAKLQFPNGHMDAKGAKVVLDIVEFLYSRVYGSVIQKHQVQQQSLHLHAKVPHGTTEPMQNRIEELKEKLVGHRAIVPPSTESE